MGKMKLTPQNPHQQHWQLPVSQTARNSCQSTPTSFEAAYRDWRPPDPPVRILSTSGSISVPAITPVPCRQAVHRVHHAEGAFVATIPVRWQNSGIGCARSAGSPALLAGNIIRGLICLKTADGTRRFLAINVRTM